ncbi:protease SohB [Sinimarinibacterium thermocellulolyticum]|uniref:Protease SohB n=1 Tax=Sinimarinibacterium thermocellulolyticum TaxID=3170016 RepID=A0ABV2A5H8_9GAMM
MLEPLLQEYLLFLAKTVTVVLAMAAAVMIALNAVRLLNTLRDGERLHVRSLNQRFQDLADAVRETVLPDAQIKKLRRQRKAEAKARHKGHRAERPRVFVLDFDGDLHAHAVEALREEVSAVLQAAQPGDEVLLRLESEGGLVHAYGLAASQLARFRAASVPLTVAIDKVAASGGYLMACVANRILAAPFAIVGSIGVVAQLPNFHRLLRRMDVDYELHTAGEFKRTLTLFGENTEAGRAKFKQEIEDTHQLFKQFIAEHRPQLDLAKVATGEHWFGARALALKLVDALQTSDDFLLQKADEAELIALRYQRRPRLAERLAHSLTTLGMHLRRGLQSGAGARWR